MSRLLVVSLLCMGLVSATPFAGTIEDDPVCGPHPLKAIIQKVEHAKPGIDENGMVAFLTKLKTTMPAVWKVYEAKLAKYQNCRVMTVGGSMGRRKRRPPF